MGLMGVSALGAILGLLVPLALLLLLLYVVVRRAVRDGIRDAQSTGPAASRTTGQVAAPRADD